MAHEFDGQKYRKASGHQREWGERLVNELSLKGNERVLDLGCGDGSLTSTIASAVPHGSVLGIDASKGMIEAAEGLAGLNLEFELLPIEQIDFYNEFDVVFSNATLHWVKDHVALLENVFRALKPGGVLRFNFAADGNCDAFYRVAREMMGRQEYAGYFSDFEWPWFMPVLEEYEMLLMRSPFTDYRVWGENADRTFGDAEAITGWIDQPAIVPFLSAVDEPDKQRFRDEVVAEMLEKTGKGDGTYFETFRRINVVATTDLE